MVPAAGWATAVGISDGLQAANTAQCQCGIFEDLTLAARVSASAASANQIENISRPSRLAMPRPGQECKVICGKKSESGVLK
jgi:hypothetical protein